MKFCIIGIHSLPKIIWKNGSFRNRESLHDKKTADLEGIYGDLVYKFKRIVGKPYFSDQFKKIIKRYKRVGYNMDSMRQSACLVVNPITVYSYGVIFNCMTVNQASDYGVELLSIGWCLMLVVGWGHCSSS